MAMFSKLKQYKDLRGQAKTMQNALAGETVYADANHGKVQIVMDGNQQVNGVQVDPEYLRIEKKADLEKHLQEAFNSGVKKSQMAMAKKAKEMGNLNLPGLS